LTSKAREPFSKEQAEIPVSFKALKKPPKCLFPFDEEFIFFRDVNRPRHEYHGKRNVSLFAIFRPFPVAIT